jgi:hypothetical protein
MFSCKSILYRKIPCLKIKNENFTLYLEDDLEIFKPKHNDISNFSIFKKFRVLDLHILKNS